MISASLARTNERVHVHNERNFPQAKFNSEINARFLLNGRGNLYFLMHDNSVRIILLNFKKKAKNFIGGKKDIGERRSKPLFCDANYDRENNDSTNTLRARRFKWSDVSTIFFYFSSCLILSTCQVFFP